MFFALPVRVHGSAPREAIPFANGLIVVLNVLAFTFGWSRYWYVGPPGTGLPSIVTYAFAHASVAHLMVNMWILLLFGNPVNRRLGNGYYGLLYFGTVITLGALARLLAGGYLLGSSGAIFAVIAVFLCLMPGSRIEIYYLALFPVSLLFGLFQRPAHWVFWFIRWDHLSIRALWAIVLVPLLEIFGLFWWGWNWTNLGHLLGLMCGVAAVLLLPTAITMNKRRMAWED
jgi:membrane associated rhomboid family serine protease